MLQNLYSFIPQVILRTPAQPFTLAIDAASIEAAVHDAHFMEAIYLASPALHEECGKWRRGELTDVRKLARLQNTVARYYAAVAAAARPSAYLPAAPLLSGERLIMSVWHQRKIAGIRA